MNARALLVASLVLVLAACSLTAVGCGTKVPNVVGDSYLVARSLLASNGFKIEARDIETHRSISPDASAKVLAQSPAGGSRSSTRATVTVYLKPTFPVSNEKVRDLELLCLKVSTNIERWSANRLRRPS